MAKPAAFLTEPHLPVDPGQRVTTELVLRNNASTVGQYRIAKPHYCEPAKWVSFHRKGDRPGAVKAAYIDLSLLGGDETRVMVTFEPPAETSTPPGRNDYLITVDALEADQESTAVEGWLDVAPIASTKIRVAPKKAKGRSKASYRVAVLNSGNTAARVRLGTDDFDTEAISVTWSPKEIELRPEEHAEFLVEVSARKSKVVGRPQVHGAAFSSRALTQRGQSDPSPPKRVEFEQKVWIPAGIIALFAMLAAAVAAFVLLRPSDDPTFEPPNPPTDLAGHASAEAANLTWKPDARAVETEVRLIDCASGIAQADPQRFKAGAGTFALAPVEDGSEPTPLCFQARSIGQHGTGSVWADAEQMLRASNELPPPADVKLGADGTLAWAVAEGADYELIVDNAPFEILTDSPVNLLSKAIPPGEHEIRLRALLDGEVSPTTEPIAFTMPLPAGDEVAAGEAGEEGELPGQPGGPGLPGAPGLGTETGDVVGEETSGEQKPPPVVQIDGPWVMLAIDPIGEKVTVPSIKAFVANKGGEYASRIEGIQRIELAANQAGPAGGPVVYQKPTPPGGPATEPVVLNQRYLIADVGGGLTADQAVDYCRVILNAISSSPTGLGFLCVPYDAEGNQLKVPSDDTTTPSEAESQASASAAGSGSGGG